VSAGPFPENDYSTDLPAQGSSPEPTTPSGELDSHVAPQEDLTTFIPSSHGPAGNVIEPIGTTPGAGTNVHGEPGDGSHGQQVIEE